MIAPERPRTGLTALKARVKVRGLSAIDGRSQAAKALFDWRAELLADLGGEEHVSAAKRALVERAARTLLFLDHVDVALMEQPTLITRRGTRLKPIVEQRQRLLDSLARILALIGLERVKRPPRDLDAYVAAKYGHRPAPARMEPATREPSPPVRPKRSPVA